LGVPFPVEWSVANNTNGSATAIVPGHSSKPDLIVDVSAVRPAPPVADLGFLTREIRAGLDEQASVTVDDAGKQQSTTGWPVSLLRCTVGADKLIEQRMLAVYALPDRIASVLIRGTDPKRWTDNFAALGEIVLAADLDWTLPSASLEALLGPVS